VTAPARKGETFPGGFAHPPAHPNCRCVLVAWRPEWDAPAPPAEQRPEPRPAAPPVRKPGARDHHGVRPSWLSMEPAAARRALEGELEGMYGLRRRAVGTKGAVVVEPPGPGGLAGMHANFHDWDGTVHIGANVAEAMERAGSGEALDQRKMEEMIVLDRVRTMVHETVHGYGPINRSMAVGHGIVVEEMATETVARAYMRDQLGLEPKSVHERLGGDVFYGGYQRYLDRAHRAVAKVASHAQVNDLWERACVAYKQNPTRAEDADHGLDLFLEGFPEEMRAPLRPLLKEMRW
jgi:hypothetical protein